MHGDSPQKPSGKSARRKGLSPKDLRAREMRASCRLMQSASRVQLRPIDIAMSSKVMPTAESQIAPPVAPPPSVEERLLPEVARRRRILEGRPQGMGHGKKLLPFQILDPVMAWIRRGLGWVGGYDRLAQRAAKLALSPREHWLVGAQGPLDGFRILHLTDLHIDSWRGMGRHIGRFCESQDFDLCVITGDLRLDIKGPIDGVLREMDELIPSLNCRHGTVAVLGNHDTLDLVEPLESAGVRYLLNESLSLELGSESLHLVGVDDAHFFGTDDVDRAFSGVPVDELCVFLCHSPDLILEAAASYADLYLCGHTHGGQICLPGGHPLVSNASCARRFTSGSWLYGSMRGHTSRGVGFSGVPFRSFCRAEVAIHTLRAERRNRCRVELEEARSREDPVYPKGLPVKPSHDLGDSAD